MSEQTMTREEWERRYAARLMERGGMEERPAILCAREAADELLDPEDSDAWLDPEGDADEEMSYWEDDGED